MARVAAEFQDVPLRNAQVLEDLPRGVFRPLRPGSLQVEGKSGQSFLRLDVGLPPDEQFSEVFAQRLIDCHHVTLSANCTILEAFGLSHLDPLMVGRIRGEQTTLFLGTVLAEVSDGRLPFAVCWVIIAQPSRNQGADHAAPVLAYFFSWLLFAGFDPADFEGTLILDSDTDVGVATLQTNGGGIQQASLPSANRNTP